MNHDEIRAHDIRARYAAGQLAAADEIAFETHLMDCHECADAVRAEIGLREGLRTIAGDRPRSSPPRSPSRAMPLLAAASLVLAAGSGWLAYRSSTALDRERQAHAVVEPRANETVAALERRLSELEAEPRRAAAPPPPPSSAPIAPATVFALTTVRSASPRDQPINLLRLADTADVVVLSVEVPAAGKYAVRLTDRAAKKIFSGADFRASADGMLGVAVDRSLLAAGDYTLAVSHVAAGNRATTVSHYTFRVTTR